MGAEQRRGKRIHFEMPVHVSAVNDDHTTGPEEVAKLYDLSAGGCAFYFNREIPIGTRVQVRITLNEDLARRFDKPELTARGVICRIEHHLDAILLGVRFVKEH